MGLYALRESITSRPISLDGHRVMSIALIDYAIEAVNQKPRWIPVSEKMPEQHVEVLATTIWDSVTIAERISENDWFIHEGHTNADTDDIMAWQPLPESYKAESEDKE